MPTNLINFRRFNRYPQAAVMLFAVAAIGLIALRSHAAGLAGDINHDGTVNVFDLSIMLSDWGTNNATADLNGDGTVNVFDLSTLLSHWGQTGGTPAPSA